MLCKTLKIDGVDYTSIAYKWGLDVAYEPIVNRHYVPHESGLLIPPFLYVDIYKRFKISDLSRHVAYLVAFAGLAWHPG